MGQFQSRIKDTTRRTMALVSELTMQQVYMTPSNLCFGEKCQEYIYTFSNLYVPRLTFGFDLLIITDKKYNRVHSP